MRTWWVPAGIGRVGGGRVLVDAEHVVDELGLAVLEVHGPATEAAALGDDHAVGAAVGDVDVGGDGERLVLDADDAVLRQPAHAGEEQLRVAADERRPSGHRRLEPLGGAVVQREHVVLDGLDQPQPLQLGQHARAVRRRGRGPGCSRWRRRRAPTRRRRTPAARHRPSPTASCAWSPRSSPCGRCRGWRTSRSTAGRDARARRRR